jgi:hypothetical protein
MLTFPCLSQLKHRGGENVRLRRVTLANGDKLLCMDVQEFHAKKLAAKAQTAVVEAGAEGAGPSGA